MRRLLKQITGPLTYGSFDPYSRQPSYKASAVALKRG